MRCLVPIALLFLGLVFVQNVSAQQYGQGNVFTVDEAEQMCTQGDMQLCVDLLDFMAGRCRQGDQGACMYARDVDQFMAEQQRQGGGSYGYQGGGWRQQGSPVDLGPHENACQNGNMNACGQLLEYMTGQCRNAGIQEACAYARNVELYMRNVPQDRPRYQHDPLTPGQRGTIGEANDYINSKCADPDMAAQLRAFGYCK